VVCESSSMKGREPREVSPETSKMLGARGSLERPKGKADPRPMRGKEMRQ